MEGRNQQALPMHAASAARRLRRCAAHLTCCPNPHDAKPGQVLAAAESQQHGVALASPVPEQPPTFRVRGGDPAEVAAATAFFQTYGFACLAGALDEAELAHLNGWYERS